MRRFDSSRCPLETYPNGRFAAQHLNSVQKYVASTTLQHVDWQNSTLLKEDVAEEVAKLKQQPGKNIAVLGSGNLVQTLMKNDPVDEYSLSVFLLVLGSGKRLFPDRWPDEGACVSSTRRPPAPGA